MINLYKYLFIILLLLNGCQGAKNALTGNGQDNTDEFMVEKKNPLVLPPEFKKLPEPGKTNDAAIEEENFNLERIFNKDSISNNKSSKSKESNDSLEKSILDKIQKN